MREEKEPKDGPTEVTVPKDARSLLVVSNETFSTCAASPASLTVMRPYLSRPLSVHASSSEGIGPICARMSAWWEPDGR